MKKTLLQYLPFLVTIQRVKKLFRIQILIEAQILPEDGHRYYVHLKFYIYCEIFRIQKSFFLIIGNILAYIIIIDSFVTTRISSSNKLWNEQWISSYCYTPIRRTMFEIQYNIRPRILDW